MATTDEFTLYYTPGACSLSPHIALREADLTFQLVRVDLKTKSADWLAINPKGYVPALRLPGGPVLTEGAVLVQYIADQRPDARLLPAAGTLERYRQQEWLHFIATELHKGMGPLYSSLANADYKTYVRERLGHRLGTIAVALRDKPFLNGDRFGVTDGYAFYVLRTWLHVCKQDLAPWPELLDYYQRMSARPAVAAALEVEGIQA
ncbi:MAG: glutathione transferase GstA [Kofleriaceae bacterium]